MSETEKQSAETTEAEEIIEAEVLSEEVADTPTPSSTPRLITIALITIIILSGVFWLITQELSQRLTQQLTTQLNTQLEQQITLSSQQSSAQGQKHRQEIEAVHQQISQLIQQVETQRESSTRFNTRLTQQQQVFDKLQTLLETSLQQQEQLVQQLLRNNLEQSRHLNQSVAALARRVDRRESNFHIAAALRLLQIAEEQLLIVKDLEAAQQALAQAGQQISASGDPILLPIQEVIQQEITQIRETPTPDLAHALSQLHQTISLVATLPFDQPGEYQPTVTAIREEPTQWNWEWIANKVWQDLLSLVRIDKQDSELPVIASRSEAELSRLILRLRLEQAQSTLLMRNTPLYRERIQSAIDWLLIFDQNSSEVMALRKQLNTLKELQLQLDLPTIGEAHRRLREIVAERRRQAEEAKQQAEAVTETTTEEVSE